MTGVISRRLLLAAGLMTTVAGCAAAPGTASTTTTKPAAGPRRFAYGPDQSQWGDLYLPAAVTKPPVVVVVHGGFWLSEYSADLGAPLAADLATRGWAAWNLEYRRLGNGGGWPQTAADIATGIDHLATVAGTASISLDRVVAVGHSAGGQLAVWAAGSRTLGVTSSPPRVPLTGVVSQAGVLDLVGAAEMNLGGGAVQQLLGGEPSGVPDRYRWASPQQNLPCRVPVRCVHGEADLNVPFAQSHDYVAAARRVGADATLTSVPGDHFSLITTSSPAWAASVAAVAGLLG